METEKKDINKILKDFKEEGMKKEASNYRRQMGAIGIALVGIIGLALLHMDPEKIMKIGVPWSWFWYMNVAIVGCVVVVMIIERKFFERFQKDRDKNVWIIMLSGFGLGFIHATALLLVTSYLAKVVFGIESSRWLPGIIFGFFGGGFSMAIMNKLSKVYKKEV